jgi:hypothetical protein
VGAHKRHLVPTVWNWCVCRTDLFCFQKMKREYRLQTKKTQMSVIYSLLAVCSFTKPLVMTSRVLHNEDCCSLSKFKITFMGMFGTYSVFAAHDMPTNLTKLQICVSHARDSCDIRENCNCFDWLCPWGRDYGTMHTSFGPTFWGMYTRCTVNCDHFLMNIHQVYYELWVHFLGTSNIQLPFYWA